MMTDTISSLITKIKRFIYKVHAAFFLSATYHKNGDVGQNILVT